MVRSLYVDNYKTLVNFKIDFSNINILIGLNGSGKTSVFEVINKLCEFVLKRRSVDEVFSSATLTRWQQPEVQTFELVIEENGRIYTYHLEIEHAEEHKKRVRSEYVKIDDKLLFFSEKGSAKLYNDRFDEGPELLWDWLYSGVGAVYERGDNQLLMKFKQALSKVIVCRIKTKEGMGKALEEALLPNGDFTNVAAVYIYISQRYPDSVERIRSSLKEINQNFKNVYIDNVGKEKVLMFDFDNHGTVFRLTFEELSDGEKAIFQAYILADCFKDKGFSLFVDEPDNYMSLKEIQPWCMDIEDLEAGQCVIISHHPEMIDFFAQSNGIWLSRLEYGATRIIRDPGVEYGDGRFMKYSELIKMGDIDEFK